MSDPTSEAIRAELARLQTENTNLKSQVKQFRLVIDEADQRIQEILTALKAEQAANTLDRASVLLKLAEAQKQLKGAKTGFFLSTVIGWLFGNLIAFLWTQHYLQFHQ